ncbi:MAG: cell division protein ZapA [Deltaproteobacteria bacterium]|nr:cell division protein ZapA [Deltaproteobacteria bacterium]
MTSQQRVTIRVLGKEYTFETQGDPAEVREAARLAEETIQRVQSHFANRGQGDKAALLVLAIMDICGRYAAFSKEHQRFIERIGARSEALLDRIRQQTEGRVS